MTPDLGQPGGNAAEPQGAGAGNPAVEHQAQTAFSLWAGRRVGEPDVLRARAATVANVATAAAAGAIVALITRADHASILALILMCLALIAFIAAVSFSFVALVRPVVHASRTGLTAEQFVDAVGIASRQESEKIRPWLQRAGWASGTAVLFTLASLVTIVVAPRAAHHPNVTLQLTLQGEDQIAALCGERVSAVDGVLKSWGSVGSIVEMPKEPCRGIRQLWLPASSVAMVVER